LYEVTDKFGSKKNKRGGNQGGNWDSFSLFTFETEILDSQPSAFIVLLLGVGFGIYFNGGPEITLMGLPEFSSPELASAGAKTDNWSITLIVAVLSFATNLAIGFATGLVVEKVSNYFKGNS